MISYNKHRRQINTYRIIVVVLLLVIVYFVFDPSFPTLENKGSGSSSSGGGSDRIAIKDLIQNSNAYLGEEVTIKGQMSFRIGGKSLDDKEGYWVWLENSCLEEQRNYENVHENPNSREYTAKGIFASPNKEYSDYRIICNSPVY